MNKPKYEKGDRIYVYNKCEAENCLEAGEPKKINGINYILCAQHSEMNDDEEIINDDENDE